MFATRWEPFAEMNRLSRELDRLFGASGNGMSRALGSGTYPAINVWKDADHFYVEAELPGFELDDLEIYVTGNELTIKGQRSEPASDGGTWLRQERGYGRFSRMIELPGEVDGDQVSAELKHGVLTVTLPKSAAVKPRRIEVRAS